MRERVENKFQTQQNNRIPNPIIWLCHMNHTWEYSFSLYSSSYVRLADNGIPMKRSFGVFCCFLRAYPKNIYTHTRTDDVQWEEREITQIFVAKKTNKRANKQEEEEEEEELICVQKKSEEVLRLVCVCNVREREKFVLFILRIGFSLISLFWTNSKKTRNERTNERENHLHILHTVEFVD